ncbi:MAG: mannose-6-phosphate isomerase [Verrucomicrobia bacterium]|nr:mannose-6-phosphate isomerase [Verrucomicrobiota bacterium]
MLYPFLFHPILKERIWGGRNLARLYGKPLPDSLLIGESWEISDRPDAVSVIANGPLAGRSLRWLMENHRDDLLGAAPALNGRFPLLLKILDAQQVLSLQVHPPAGVAEQLAGEPKTEMWYIAEAAPGAELFVGLRRGVTRSEFESKMHGGDVATCFHRVAVRRGDVMFLPSGRVHAIGAGLVIFEIQQNSDTTYRVFDWNRTGSDGRKRPLHVDEALASIDFKDFEPSLISRHLPSEQAMSRRLVNTGPFMVEEKVSPPGMALSIENDRATIIAVLSGTLLVDAGEVAVRLSDGQFCLIPACVRARNVRAETTVQWLRIEPDTAAEILSFPTPRS